jgi:altronate hydrolase
MPHKLSAMLKIHPADTVAVALRPLAPGEQIAGVRLTEPVPQGHKVALADLPAGAVVTKYGQPIGRSSAAITAGAHVHSHNLVTALEGELAYRPGVGPHSATAARDLPTWQGYLRADGRAATRNEIWILPTVGCVGITAEEVARAARGRHAGRIDGIHAFAHPHGCSQLGDDLDGTRALLAGLAANPNAAGVLLLGLGCESNQLDALLAAVPEAARNKVRLLSSQSAGDEMAAAAVLIDELVEEAALARRETLPFSALTIGLKCGGSDGFSGLTANPMLGRLADRLCSAGGQAILTEIPEIFGAEQALLDRAVDAAVFDAAAGLVNRFKRYYLDQGLPVSENPSPGNLAGGITTLEEKSLGAVQKGGNAPLVDVIGYGRQARKAGLTLLEAPGNDAVSSSALAAAGATLLLFTTGRGTPLGFPVPTVKVASNQALAEAKPHWIDFDASIALRDGLDPADRVFAACLAAIASGTPTVAERRAARNRDLETWCDSVIPARAKHADLPMTPVSFSHDTKRRGKPGSMIELRGRV